MWNYEYVNSLAPIRIKGVKVNVSRLTCPNSISIDALMKSENGNRKDENDNPRGGKRMGFALYKDYLVLCGESK